MIHFSTKRYAFRAFGSTPSLSPLDEVSKLFCSVAVVIRGGVVVTSVPVTHLPGVRFPVMEKLIAWVAEGSKALCSGHSIFVCASSNLVPRTSELF